MPDRPRWGPSLGLGWIRARGVWFRERHDMLGRVYTVVAVARSLLAAHAVAVNMFIVLPRAHNQAAVAAASVAIIVWHTLITLRMRKAHRRTPAAHLADLGVTLAITLTTGFVVRPGGAPLSLAGYWIGGCAAYAAIFRSTRWGVAFACAVAAVLVFTPGHFTMERLGSSFVIVLFTACLGVLITQFRATLQEQEQDRLRSAALAERERLSRIVHDGVLQVLALVEREGPSLGPRGGRLASLARESEAQLRTLLQDREIVGLEHSEVVDLAAVLDKYQSARVTVSTMASGVTAPRSLVDEVEAAVAEILTNVELHAGPEAQAWILLDQEDNDEVILWVRDNGAGMSAEQVQQAAESGRLGIRDSIVGRIGAVGGTATLRSSPRAGAEWELRVPINGERRGHSA